MLNYQRVPSKILPYHGPSQNDLISGWRTPALQPWFSTGSIILWGAHIGLHNIHRLDDTWCLPVVRNVWKTKRRLDAEIMLNNGKRTSRMQVERQRGVKMCKDGSGAICSNAIVILFVVSEFDLVIAIHQAASASARTTSEIWNILTPPKVPKAGAKTINKLNGFMYHMAVSYIGGSKSS